MSSPFHRRISSLVFRIWITALILPLPLSFGQTAGTRDVLIQASPQIYWIARVEPDDQPQRFVSIVQMRSIGNAPNWKQVTQVGHRISSLSRYGTQLAALMENGDWMTMWDGNGAPGPLPEDGSKLQMLAESPGETAKLWAIATSGKGRVPTTAGATQPAFTMPLNTRLLYRLEQGRWKLISPLPPEIAASDDVSLGATDAPLLAATNDAGMVRLFRWGDATKQWESQGTINAGTGITQTKILDGADRPMIWLSDENGSGEIRSRIDNGDLQWSRRIPVALPADAPKGAASDATIAGGNIRVVLYTHEGKLLEYSYPMDGAGPVQQANLPVVAAPTEPKAVEWMSAVAAALLMIVLVSTVRRRGQGVAPEAIEAAGLKLAPHGLRLLAGMIDALPFIGTMAVIFARANTTDPEQAAEIVQSAQPAIYVAMAVYVLHTLVSEAAWGWTIGKKICGLRVVTVDGLPPDLKAVILRNVLRIIDATMSFLPALFVLVSPLRQRPGDIAADTIVVLADAAFDKPKAE